MLIHNTSSFDFFLLSTYYVATVAVVINNNDHHPVTVQILLHVLVKTAGCTRVLKFSQLFGKGVGGLAWLVKQVSGGIKSLTRAFRFKL